MSKKIYMRPRSLSSSMKPASSRQLYNLQNQRTLPPLRNSSRDINIINNSSPQSKNERVHRLSDTFASQFSNSLHYKLTKAKNTQSMKAPMIPSKRNSIQTVSYTIKLISNWGSPNLIACSEIIPIDLNNHHVPVIKITAAPKKVEETELDKLIEGFESHEDSNDIWTSPWPQEIPIEITIDVPIDSPLKMVRFFNASGNYKEAGIRNVEIWSDDVMLWLGEIPCDFPFLAHLRRPTDNVQEQLQAYLDQSGNENLPTPHQHAVLPKNPMNCYVDPFGIVPQLATKSLKIEFISNYANTSSFGLSGIEVVDTKKNVIPSDQFSEVKIHHLSSAGNPTTLFRGHYIDPKIDDMFVFERSSNELNPIIEILFNEPILVGQLRIWNFFPSNGNDDEYGSLNALNKAKLGICTKKISIKFDNDNLLFIGCINQGDGTLQKLELSMTLIFVNEMDYKFMKYKKYQNPQPDAQQEIQLNKNVIQVNSAPIPKF